MRSGASGAFGWPTTRSWTRSAPSTRRSARTESLPSGSTSFRRRSTRPSAARSCTRATGRFSLPAGCGGSPPSGRGRSRDRRGDASRVARRPRRRARRHRHRRLHERPAAGARPDDQTGPRPGDRHRAAGGDAVSAAALRAPRLRLLAADRRTAARPRRPARQEPRRGVHERGDDHGADPGRARGLRGRARSAQSRASSTAGRASSARPRTTSRSSGPVPGRDGRLGLSRLLGPRQRHGPRAAASSWRRRSSVRLRQSSQYFDPARLL